MGKWAKSELKESKLLRDRLLNMMSIILGEQTHDGFAQDFGKTFETGRSDHLAQPMRSWTEHHQNEVDKEGEFVFGGTRRFDLSDRSSFLSC